MSGVSGHNRGMTPNPSIDEWLPKAAAAKLLGVSDRQLARRAAEGLIRKTTADKDPGERVARVLYSGADILALASGRPNRYQTPAVELATATTDVEPVRLPPARALSVLPAGTTRDVVPTGQVDPWRDLAALLANLDAHRRDYPEKQPKPWLTLEEAAEYSGLPASWLRARAEDASIQAVNVGSGTIKKLWRFNRDGLSKIGC